MYLSDKRYEEIKKIITEVFDDYQICSLPIDVEQLTKKMNISIIKYSSCGLRKQNFLLNASSDGLSYYDEKKKKFFIYCNDMNCNQQRLRFTIMHEIGHIVLGHKYSNEKNESEADYFARNALAPMAIVISKNITSPEKIMELFDISYQCSGIVLRNLGMKIQYGHMILEKYDIELLKLFNL